MVSFGLFGIISAILVLFLTETLHKPLGDEIFEVLQSKNGEKTGEETKPKNDDGSFYLDAKQENPPIQEPGQSGLGDSKDSQNDSTRRKNKIKI
jgi:hypothetical protein